MPSSLSHLFMPVGSLDEARRLYVDLRDPDGRPISIYTPTDPASG